MFAVWALSVHRIAFLFVRPDRLAVAEVLQRFLKSALHAVNYLPLLTLALNSSLWKLICWTLNHVSVLWCTGHPKVTSECILSTLIPAAPLHLLPDFLIVIHFKCFNLIPLVTAPTHKHWHNLDLVLSYGFTLCDLVVFNTLLNTGSHRRCF